MSTGNACLNIAGIEIDVVYKDIKNLHISVYPPIGRVRVSAPHRIDLEAIRLAVIQRLPWIKRQQRQMQYAPRQTERRMLSGETHYLWGDRYRLDVSRQGRPKIEVAGKQMYLTSPRGSNPEVRRAILERWYRRQLKAALPALIEKWQSRLGVQTEKVGIRRMKTKWGSCLPESQRVWINPELVKKNPRCLEYVVVHELMHLLERGHGERFVLLMDKHLPDWRQRRDELNGAPLAHENWKNDERPTYGPR
jgi:predicted metal-dependent hydrolase